MKIYCEECGMEVVAVESPESWPAAILRKLPRICRKCEDERTETDNRASISR